MIIIVCGEDIIVSRNYFLSLINNFRKKKYQIINTPSSQVINQYLELKSHISLFGENLCLTTENFYQKELKKILKKESVIKELVSDKNSVILTWEESLGLWEINQKKGFIIKEFKPANNLFKLLDSFYPGNRKEFIENLNLVTHNTDSYFIFNMLIKRVRLLLEIKSGLTANKIQNWQLNKLKKQAKFWTFEKLIKVYLSLFNIELLNKTSSNPFKIKESLEILACYLL